MKTTLFILNLIVCIAFVSVVPPNDDTLGIAMAWFAFGVLMFFVNLFLYGAYVLIRKLFLFSRKKIH
jgi:hypothetical protein